MIVLDLRIPSSTLFFAAFSECISYLRGAGIINLDKAREAKVDLGYVLGEIEG